MNGDPRDAMRALERFRARIEAHGRIRGLSREDAEDIAQETLIRSRETAFDGRDPLNYLLKVAERLMMDLARKSARRPQCTSVDWGLEDGVTHYDLQPAPEVGDEPLVSDEARALFSALVSGLPDEQRLPLLMLARNHTYREIAAEMMIPVGTVRSRVHRARHNVRQALLALRN